MSSRRKYNSNNFLDNLKDYIVPIIGILLILLLIYFFFFSGDTKKVEERENRIGINLTLENTDSKAKIVYSKGTSEDINIKSKLYKGEKVVVSEGRLKIVDTDKYSFNIDKLGELKYSGDKYFSVLNGKVWLDTKIDLKTDMKYFKTNISKNSHISFIQNEVASTLYVISGMAEVTTNAGKKVVLNDKEKIEISRIEGADNDLDISLKKEKLDDIFKVSEWFIVNSGASYLESKTEEETGTGKTEEESNISSNSSTNYITFNNLIDGSNVSGTPINIYGTISGDDVDKILVNNANVAKIIKENKTFSIEGVDVSNKVNDLVFKIYDSANEEIEKFVYTVYYDGAKITKNNTNKQIKSNNFSADAGDFSFTYPSKDGLYTSNEDIITIKGKVTAEGIDKVTVNGYRLKSFNGKTWMYHANKDFGNMQDGTNQYEIKYYKGDSMVYKNYYTIVKKIGEKQKTNSSTGTTE